MSELLAVGQSSKVALPSLWHRLCSRIIYWEWLWLLLILPVVLFPTPTRVLVLLLLPLLWFVRWVATGRFVPATPLNGTILAFLFMVLVSLYATFDIAFSLSKLAGLVYGVAVFYAVVAIGGRNIRSFFVSLAGFLTLGVTLTSLGLLATRWSSIKVPLLEPLRPYILPRIPLAFVGLPGASNGVNPNELAGMLLWLIPVAVVASLLPLLPGIKLPWWKRLGLLLPTWVTVIFLGSVLALTQSRSGLLGFTLALPLVAIIPLWRYRIALLGLALVTGLAAFFLLSQESGKQPAEFYLNEASSRFVADAKDTVLHLEAREAIWSHALAAIHDFPWTGIGVGTFRVIFPRLYPSYGRITEEGPPHAHNHILQAALDIGVPGLVAYLGLWLSVAIMLQQMWQRATASGSRLLVLAFVSALLGYFIYGLTDTIALGAKPGFLLWFLFGLIAAYHRTIVPVIWK